MPRDDAAAPGVAEARSPSLSPASAVMFVTELDRAVAFYADLLAWTVAVQDLDAALLTGQDGIPTVSASARAASAAQYRPCRSAIPHLDRAKPERTRPMGTGTEATVKPGDTVDPRRIHHHRGPWPRPRSDPHRPPRPAGSTATSDHATDLPVVAKDPIRAARSNIHRRGGLSHQLRLPPTDHHGKS